MIVHRTRTGYVVQEYDTEAKRFIRQDFIEEDSSDDWEDPNTGEFVDAPDELDELQIILLQPGEVAVPTKESL